MVTDTDDSDSKNEDSVMHLLIYPEDYNDEDSLSNPPSTEPTPEPGPPSKKLPRKRPRNLILITYQNLPLPQGRIPLVAYPQKAS